MAFSLSRQLLPWTLPLGLILVAVIFFVRAPKGEFEFDLSDPKVAESPAAPYYHQMVERLRKKGGNVQVAFRSGLLYHQAEFIREPEPCMVVYNMVLRPKGNGAVLNENEVSRDAAAHRLRHYCAAAKSVSSVPFPLHEPPEGTVRQWAEFLRAMKFSGYWGVPYQTYGSR